jgi:hypothetical protein
LLVGATEWLIAPPSDHCVQTYCVPGVPVCGDAVLSECEEPETHVNVCPEVYVVPSTVNDRPVGLVFTRIETAAEKFPVSVIGPFMVTDAGLFDPLYEPDPLPVHPANTNPEFGVALIDTFVPAFRPLRHSS